MAVQFKLARVKVYPLYVQLLAPYVQVSLSGTEHNQRLIKARNILNPAYTQPVSALQTQAVVLSRYFCF